MHNFTSNFLSSERSNVELERENEKLMFELKQTKMELALCQEKSAATELGLKKEILNL